MSSTQTVKLEVRKLQPRDIEAVLVSEYPVDRLRRHIVSALIRFPSARPKPKDQHHKEASNAVDSSLSRRLSCAEHLKRAFEFAVTVWAVFGLTAGSTNIQRTHD